jgi:hypothetical protein
MHVYYSHYNELVWTVPGVGIFYFVRQASEREQ